MDIDIRLIHSFALVHELELELIQSNVTIKKFLRGEVYDLQVRKLWLGYDGLQAKFATSIRAVDERRRHDSINIDARCGGVAPNTHV